MSSASPVSVPAPATPTATSPTLNIGVLGAGTIMFISSSLIISILFSYGAAKLSYDRFQSLGWAVIAFLFSGFYYPYYALFVSTPSPISPPLGMLGARRRR